MDLSKYPLEKLFHFAAGIIPGSVALLVFQLTNPGSFGWFFALGYLGYKTKLGLVLLVAFIIGNSMTAFLGGILGALGGYFGNVIGRRPFRPPHSFETAPWRDPLWRTLLKKHLGAQSPKETPLISREIFDLRSKAIEMQPEPQRSIALADLNLEKINSEIEDSNWARWYDHYHYLLFRSEEQDFVWQVRSGLNFNLQTAAVYILISALFVPNVRHWWCILLACIWVLALVAESFSQLRRVVNKWSTLSEQTIYLSRTTHDVDTSEGSSKGAQQVS